MDLRQIGTREREREREREMACFGHILTQVYTHIRWGGGDRRKNKLREKREKIRNIIEILSDARAVQPV